MAGRPALLGHEAEHQRRVQQSRVGGGEIPRDQHVRLVAVRHTRHRHAQQARHDPVAHVVQVGHPAGHVLAGPREQLAVGGERVIHAALGGAADRDAAVDVRDELRVLGDHGLSLKHVLGLAAGQLAARDQVGRDRADGLTGAPLLALRLRRGDLLGRRFENRRAHVPDLADRHTVAHADASQRCLHFTRLR
ncbi:hypothetical protein GCM10020254_69120 [Streptomyces goshikiensis]